MWFLFLRSQTWVKREFEHKRIIPVYVSFTQGSILQLNDDSCFYQWMLAKLCSSLIRSLKKFGFATPKSMLSTNELGDEEYLSKLVSEFEDSWKKPNHEINAEYLPSVDDFKESIEDICEEAGIECVNLFIDEAAHILRPAQQRQFFSLYRDLNSPYINCNAAVYPGVTSFGDNFQPIHDATFIDLERDTTSVGYIDYMRSIIEKQAGSSLLANIAKNITNFMALAYSANGNPRILLKTVARCPAVSSREVNTVIKEFYKSEIWEEHTLLGEKYEGFKGFIDWGRNFIEDFVLPEIKSKNDSYLAKDKKTSTFFWIHRDTPEGIKKSLNLLCYTGIIALHTEAVKATRSEVGKRYCVNLGCLLALENTPVTTGVTIVKNPTVKRMSEFGSNHTAYKLLKSDLSDFNDTIVSEALNKQLSKSVDYLDLPSWLITSLKGLDMNKIKDVLTADEKDIQKSYYVGKVRSRYIKNEAISAVFEYLAG
jgi:hypothetical protein